MVNGTDILIAAGGTGGHLFPGIAIAEEMRRRNGSLRILFAGTGRGLEATLCPKLGLPLILMGSSSIKDRKGIARIAAWGRLPLSVMRAISILKSQGPRLLVSVGGYAAGPLSLAAWLLRIPFVLIEPNAIAGLTNRVIGRFCRRAFVQFAEACSFFPAGRAIVTGNPVRSEVLSARRERAHADGPLTVFVFGGSQGALRLNRAMLDAVALMGAEKEKIRLIHQTGSNDDVRTIERVYRDAGFAATVFPFAERIWEHYARADLVVARAGATTVAELSVLALPSILVPYPFAADDHQRANARGMARLGGAVVIDDGECTGERLKQELMDFVDRPSRLDAMRAALKSAGRPDAAQRIVDESFKLMS
ncbi:MAG: undecaprenyldiphospho-muramoylpentapeptide beta-N-acetylglucosaminyltransferase [Pseudomonadota bacterium]